jgi:hypothetical protein
MDYPNFFDDIPDLIETVHDYPGAGDSSSDDFLHQWHIHWQVKWFFQDILISIL